MARDIPLGNGQMLVAFDTNGLIRDVYYPHVGQENHVGGAPFRVGVWEDGAFDWLPDGWTCEVGYLDDTLVTRVVWTHMERGLRLEFNDAVDFHENALIRKITVSDTAGRKRMLRLFFGFDFSIGGNDIGDTVALRPEAGCVVHYKHDRYFLMNALLCGRAGFDQYAMGNKRKNAFEGTWKDAEDGVLGGNPIAQGSVDSVVALHVAVESGGAETAWLWIAAGESWNEVLALNRDLVKRGPAQMFRRTHDYWRLWATKEPGATEGLPAAVAQLYRRSLLIMRTQIDRNGAIVAANDSDNVQFNRDTYSYVWPRDGALVAHALDLAGYPEISQTFFKFCASVVEREGYLLHKYTPAGTPASSWHPWVKDARRQLPIQEDETALVLWSLWQHYSLYRDIEFVTPLYRPLIKNGANFLMNYRDGATGLPLPSYDLWEERYEVLTFTAAAVYGGLTAAAGFVEAFGEEELAEDYRKGAAALREAAGRSLYQQDTRCFARGIVFPEDGGDPVMDRVVDASVCGSYLFGLLPPDDSRVEETVGRVREKLGCATEIGGLARYENDAYYRSATDTPGNPWFVTTLWYAQYVIAKARTVAELASAMEILEWTAAHALPSGVLAEQLDPHTGKPLSVSPLTWSHAAFVTTVCEYRQKKQQMKGT